MKGKARKVYSINREKLNEAIELLNNFTDELKSKLKEND